MKNRVLLLGPCGGNAARKAARARWNKLGQAFLYWKRIKNMGGNLNDPNLLAVMEMICGTSDVAAIVSEYNQIAHQYQFVDQFGDIGINGY